MKRELEKELKSFAESTAQEMGLSDLRFNMGAYVIENTGESVSESLDKAEAARKKNQTEYLSWVTIYDNIMQDETVQKREVIYAFQNAIKTKQITVQLQPVKNVLKNEWEEVEVLARLMDSEGKMISPASFMQYLDKNGMVSELDCVVLEKSCALIKKW